MSIVVNGSNTPTAGGIGYGDGTNLAFSGAGTSGQFLSSGGSGAPTWVSAPSSAMTLISTQTASNNTSISWTGLSGYNNYRIIFTNITPASSGGTSLVMQLGTGSVPTYITSGYYFQGTSAYGSGNAGLQGTVNGTNWFVSTLNYYNPYGAGSGIFGTFDISGMINSTPTGFVSTSNFKNPDVTTEIDIIGGWNSNSTVKTAIKLYFNSTNITGTASLYGISS